MSVNDIGVWVGILSGALAITAAAFTLMWKIFRKVDQLDDAAATAVKAAGVAEAAVQSQALVDKRLVGIELELSANGGGSLKDDVQEIKRTLPDIIEGNNRARDASFLALAQPWITRVEALEKGHRAIMGRLDQLGDQIHTAAGEIMTNTDLKATNIIDANNGGHP